MICDDFQKLFPKYIGVKYVLDNAEVIEIDSKAKIKKVIWQNSSCQVFDPTLVKDLTSFFQKAESDPIFHKDCDGILLYDGLNGQKYLVLCELKSQFSTTEIYEAYRQIISSCIKFRMLMSLIPNYRERDYKVKGFIFTKPKKDILRDLYKQTLLPKKQKEQEVATFVLNLCNQNGSPHKIKSNKCSIVSHIPIGEAVLFDTLELYHIEVESAHGVCEMNALDYIK